MLSEAILLAAIQIGPFFEARENFTALRPFWASDGQTTDVAWPVYTSHRDWWRFGFVFSGHDYPEGGGQFSIAPLWYNLDHPERGSYWGLFPLYGRHPNFALVYDLEFALWPMWMRYRMPRKDPHGEQRYLTSNVFLFPFFNFRDDGSWGIWPLYGVTHNRTSVNRYLFWPIINWAEYESDRDTSGAGSSWMVWPLCGNVSREREDQTLVLPPFISMTMTKPAHRQSRGETGFERRLRLPWPFVEWESGFDRRRLSLFPFYERVTYFRYADGSREAAETRIGWKLIELLENEQRFFPFWYSHSDGYLRLWPFYERAPVNGGCYRSRVLALMPIRHVPAVDRNWAKFWTFYECDSKGGCSDHSLLWGLVRWRTQND